MADRARAARPRGVTSPVAPLVERLFRTEAARLTAVLTRLLGASNLELAEDVTHDALLAALKRWPAEGVPANPSAWLLRVARNRALDVLRREAALRERAPAVARELESLAMLRSHAESADADIFADDALRMMLLCCHPAISEDSRVALTLKTVAGFGVGEIARAFLADDTAVAQRLVRAKRALRDAGATFELPPPHELGARMNALLDVLYLMFNEGYAAHEGEALLRRDLCREALRLAELLLAHPATAAPRVSALAALFCFHMARFDTRVGTTGELVRLELQDRTRWNRDLVARGLHHLAGSASGDEVTRFHLEAEIAGAHVGAPSWEATDWEHILRAYDELFACTRSPVVAINRVVAVWRVHGAVAALHDLEEATATGIVEATHVYHAVRGELLATVGRTDEARRAFLAAAASTRSEPIRASLAAREAALGRGNVDSAPARSS